LHSFFIKKQCLRLRASLRLRARAVYYINHGNQTTNKKTNLYERVQSTPRRFIEKNKLRNKKMHPCECGYYFTNYHKKQHFEGVIHKNYVENGIKYELPEKLKNKLYYDDKNLELYKKYYPDK